MSMSGNIVFWKDCQPTNVRFYIDALVRCSGAVTAEYVSRSRGESREWDLFQKELESPPKPDVESGGAVAWFIESEVDGEETLPPRPASTLSECYVDGSSIRATLQPSCHADRVFAAINTFPLAVRGDFAPWELILSVGWHDLFECVENDEGTLFGRAFTSISFWGYGLPEDWESFRRRVESEHAIQLVRREFEAIAGPLNQVCYWDA